MADPDRTNPLQWNSKIVNPDGTPTDFFMRQWQLAKTVGTDLNSILAAAFTASTGIQISGNIKDGITIGLADSGVTAGQYTDTTLKVPQLTIDAKGRVTAAVNTDIPVMQGDAGSGGVKGLVPAPGAGDATKALLGDGTWGSVSGSSGNAEYKVGPLVASSNFTQVNFAGTTSVSDVAGTSGDGAIVLSETADANNTHRLLYRSVPSAPYRVTFQAFPFNDLTNTTASWVSIGWYDTSTGKFQSFNIRPSGTVGVDNWTNTATFNATLVSARNLLNPRAQWYGLSDDNAGNVLFEISPDGVTWNTLTTIVKSSGFLGSSGYGHYFFGLEKNSGATMRAIIRTIDESGLSRAYP